MKGRQVMSYVLCDLMDLDGGKAHTHDGQGALWNAYLSALRLAMNLRQAILEREDEGDG